jgi:integrase
MKLYKRNDSRDTCYTVKFMVRGKRYQWSTKTNDQFLAQKRAKDYYEKVKAGAYHLVDAMHARGGSPTLGALIAEYRLLSAPAESTRNANVRSLMQVMEHAGLTTTSRIDQLTKETAAKWLQQDGSAVTLNSVLRKARSLFSRDAVATYGITVPMELLAGFMRVRYLKTGENAIDIPTPEAMGAAMAGLPAGPARNGFLLAVGCGLRSCEIQAARWDWINGNALMVGGDPRFTTKSSRYRVVAIGDDVLAQLWRDPASPFICGDGNTPAIQRQLPAMLRDCGFTMRNAVHSLRRWYACQIAGNPAQGLWEASKALGHASYKTTEQYYARILKPVGGVALPKIIENKSCNATGDVHSP